MLFVNYRPLLRPVVLSLMALCVISACVSVAYAADPTEAITEEITGEFTDETNIETIEETTTETTEESEETVTAEGEITDAQFKAYVLGFLFFFTVVILFYFSYKLFAMFF